VSLKGPNIKKDLASKSHVPQKTESSAWLHQSLSIPKGIEQLVIRSVQHLRYQEKHVPTKSMPKHQRTSMSVPPLIDLLHHYKLHPTTKVRGSLNQLLGALHINVMIDQDQIPRRRKHCSIPVAHNLPQKAAQTFPGPLGQLRLTPYGLYGKGHEIGTPLRNAEIRIKDSPAALPKAHRERGTGIPKREHENQKVPQAHCPRYSLPGLRL
jgi:hypothetical protein